MIPINPNAKTPAEMLQPATPSAEARKWIETQLVTNTDRRQARKQRQSKLIELLIWTIMLVLLGVGIWYASTPDLAPCYYDVHGNCN